jgi:hypothetical protein
MIYLAGCRHEPYQTFKPASNYFPLAQRRFESFLRNAIEANEIDLVAEELDCEYSEQKKRQSVALNLVIELKRARTIDHRYCGPTPSKRNDLGIGRGLPFIDDPVDPELSKVIQTAREAHLHDIGHRWPIRENFWIERLGNDLHCDVLFICGALHVCTFASRLRAKQIPVKVLERFFERPKGWLLSEGNAIEFAACKDVLRSGFPPDKGCFCVSAPVENSDL